MRDSCTFWIIPDWRTEQTAERLRHAEKRHTRIKETRAEFEAEKPAIRNGTQLECVNCTACIDACDHVMEKINRPKGLIRYASHEGIEKKQTRIFNGRLVAYSAVLVALLGLLVFAVTTRSNVETNVFKVPGTLYTREGSDILNLYNLEFVNKTFEPIVIDVRVESPSSAKIVRADGKLITIPAEGLTKGVYFIRIPEDQLPEARTAVKLGIYAGDQKLETITARFIGPIKQAKH